MRAGSGQSGRFFGAVVLGLALVAALAVGCEKRSPLRIRPGPLVQERSFALSTAALEKVVVIPFQSAGKRAGPVSAAPEPAAGPPGGESGALVARFVSEALSARGIAVIPPSDVELAFEQDGTPVPRSDSRASAEFALRNFGATSVLLGRVMRYREREGSAAGARRPTSVAFEVSLHEVPGGRRLWTGRFDETQHAITANVFRARQYPGAGTRWLTAAEFARWGAGEIVESLTDRP